MVVEFNGLPNNLSQEIRNILVIIVFGAFGGLLYSLRSRKAELPYVVNVEKQSSIDQEATYKKVVYLGVLADCLIGIGGALVVFLLLPPIEGEIVKLLATATIGGYGGRSLLDQALGTVIKKQEELQDKVDQTQQEIDQAKEQAEKDAQTLKLLSLYLDTSLTLTVEETEKLIANIKEASRITRTQIFGLTKLALVENRELSEKDLTDEKSPKRLVVENARKVFQALQESDRNYDNHRYPAHVAYAYMALQQWQKAIDNLDKAKEILNNINKDNTNKDYQQNRVVYESNQVICKIKIYQDINFEEMFESLKQLDDSFNELDILKDEKRLWEKVQKLIPGSDSRSIEKWFTDNQDKQDKVKQWIQEKGITLPLPEASNRIDEPGTSEI